MTYTNLTLSAGTDGATIISRIKSELSASGWTSGDNTNWTNTVDSTAMTITVPSTTMASGGVLHLQFNGQSTYLISGNSTYSSAYVGLELSIGPDHFYCKITGPGTSSPGYNNATYGSPASSVFFSRYVPYLDANSNKARHIVVAASHYTSPAAYNAASALTGLQSVVKIKTSDSDSFVDAELATVRPAIQDTAAVGDLVPSSLYGAGIVYWPFIIISSTFGVVGRIRNIFFGSDNYTLAGDTATHLQENVTINGMNYIRTLPAYFPSSNGITAYTPFGIPAIVTNQSNGITSGSPTGTTTLGGPNVVVKKGDGS